MIDLWLVFVTGLLSSLHCIGMCGPIVLAYSLSGGVSASHAVPARNSALGRVMGLHVAYNGGRIFSYSLLGALAGIAGMAFSSVQTVGEYVSIVGGAAMVVAGILLLGILPLPSALSRNKAGGGIAIGLLGRFLQSPSLKSKLLLGLLTPLLPCGILYALVVKAAATQHVGYGALTMALFAIGMAPALVLVGSLSSLFSAKVRKGAERLAAVSVILMGVILLLRGFHVPYLAWLTGGGGSDCCH